MTLHLLIHYFNIIFGIAGSFMTVATSLLGRPKQQSFGTSEVSSHNFRSESSSVLFIDYSSV